VLRKQRREQLMLQKLHQKLGTAGFVLSIVALVAALGGGAYAASGGLTGKQKKEVKKISQTEAKKFATAGPQGPAGAPGAKGDAGAAGANGTNGTNGAAGASVTGAPIAAGGACGVGVTGVKYTLGSTSTDVCNGKNGTNGTTGFTETLPPEKTETGIIGFATTFFGSGPEKSKKEAFPISFPIPLSAGAEVDAVLVLANQDSVAGCPGRGGAGSFPPGAGEVYTPGIPEAEPGFLCIYENGREGVSQVTNPFIPVNNEGAWEGVPGVSSTGTVIEVGCPPEEECTWRATWAVTAPEE
jgi:hypothetical protein